MMISGPAKMLWVLGVLTVLSSRGTCDELPITPSRRGLI